MSFRDLIADDLESVFLNTDEFAQSVIWKVAGTGDGTSITAVCSEGMGKREVVGQDGIRALVDVRTLAVRAASADVTGYARDVSTVTRDGATWTVRQASENEGMVALVCDLQSLASAGVQALRFG